jgi:hypothetical protein
VVFLFFGCGLRASMMHKWNLADMGRRKWHGGIRRIPCFLLFWESCKLSTFRKVIIRRRKWWMEESEEFLSFFCSHLWWSCNFFTFWEVLMGPPS